MRRLIVLGASVRAAAFSALRAGYEPLALDMFADRDLVAACPARRVDGYPHGFAGELAAMPDAPWLYTGGLENYPRLVDRLAAERRLLGNRGDVLRAVRDPRRLGDVLRGGGFRYPETITAVGETGRGSLRDPQPPNRSRTRQSPRSRTRQSPRSRTRQSPRSRTRQSSGGDEAARSLATSATGDSRWLIKPRRGSGGMAVRFATQHDLARPPRGTIVQAYVAGESASALFVSAAGQASLLGATRQLVGRDFGLPAPFAYAGSIGPLALSEAEHCRLTALGSLLAEHFSLVGLWGIDFIRTSDDLWPIEVNPRYAASVEVLERATGIQAMALHAAACGGDARGRESLAANDEPVPKPIARQRLSTPSASPLAGKAIVYARQAGLVPAALESLIHDWNTPGQPPQIADLPYAGQPLCAGQPVVTVFAEGSSEQDVEQRLRQRVAAVEAVLSTPQALQSRCCVGTRHRLRDI